MAKRFTDTAKWAKSNFQALKPRMKLAWIYLCDNCDHAGIWDLNLPLMSFQIGEKITLKDLEESFSDSIKIFSDKILIQAFIDFQYGNLNPDNRVHRSVINRVEKFKNKPLASPLIGAKDKDMVKDKEQDKDMEKESDELFNENLETRTPKVAPEKTLGSKIFESYFSAYQRRYGKDPIRNGTVNGQCTQIAKRLGEDGIAVADFYVRHNRQYYVLKSHPIGLLLSDAEGLHTEWFNGKQVTTTEARATENKQQVVNAWAKHLTPKE